MKDDAEDERPLRTRRFSDRAGSDPNPDAPEASHPPPLDAAFADGSARERLYSALVQTREATPAAAIAERAGCHPDTARKYLDWFAQLGLVVRHDGRPTTYERNEAYFEWRYVTELAGHHTFEELREGARSIQERLDEYRDEYGADKPGQVDAREVANETAAIDEVWNDLAHWSTLEDELRLHERARQRLTRRTDSEIVRG